MQRKNIILLRSGLNKITLNSNDLMLDSSKMPIAILPKGYKIRNIVLDINQLFESNILPNQDNNDAVMKHRMMLGIDEETQYFTIIDLTTEPSIGRNNGNTGNYFNDPKRYEENLNIILENWIIPKVWTISSNVNNGSNRSAACGNTNAGLYFSGSTTGSTTSYGNFTESYNGTNWSNENNLNTSRNSAAGCGTQTAGLCFGGRVSGNIATNITEEFSGVSWSTAGVGTLINSRLELSGCGRQDAALSVGGSHTSITEEYDGSSWTIKGDLNINKSIAACCGITTAALSFSGYDDDNLEYISYTEEYNGSIWSMGNNLNSILSGIAGSGTQNTGLAFGGTSTSYNSITEEYDGVVWKISNNLNIDRSFLSGCGSQNSSLSMGGISNTSDTALTTEVYTTSSNLTTNGSLEFNITIT